MIIKIGIIVLVLVSTAFMSTDLIAEDDSLGASINELRNRGQELSKNNANHVDGYNNHEKPSIYNSEFRSALNESAINRLEWDNWVLEHNKQIYRQHAAESRYIFWMVFALTGFSMLMVVWQFRLYSRKIQINNTSEDNTYASKGLTSGVLSISKDGIKIDTPFIGAIILVITFFFLNSYLTNVYPIHKSDQEITPSKKAYNDSDAEPKPD